MCVQLMSDSPQMWAMWLVKQAEDSHSGKMLFMFCALTKRYWWGFVTHIAYSKYIAYVTDLLCYLRSLFTLTRINIFSQTLPSSFDTNLNQVVFMP